MNAARIRREEIRARAKKARLARETSGEAPTDFEPRGVIPKREKKEYCCSAMLKNGQDIHLHISVDHPTADIVQAQQNGFWGEGMAGDKFCPTFVPPFSIQSVLLLGENE